MRHVHGASRRRIRGLTLAAALLLACASGDDDDATSPTPSPTPSPSALHPRAGVNAGQPIDDAGGVHDQSARIRETGAGWARVNFRLGSYASVDDPAWQAAFDGLVDAYVAAGVQVYGLIGGESFTSSGAMGSEEWLDDYAVAFVKIVDLFKDRVRVFESFNEPNDWGGGTSAQLPADRFARALERLYLAVKHDAGHLGDPAWQVTMVSGPLFTHDLDDGAAYLDAVYDWGRTMGAWDYACAQTGSFPLDGIGHHVYVREESTATAAEVQAALTVHADAIAAVSLSHESGCGATASKRLWVSEVSWNAEYVGEDVQARNVGVMFDVLDPHPDVAAFFWFTLDDFPGGPYGLHRLDGTRRPAWDAFHARATATSLAR